MADLFAPLLTPIVDTKTGIATPHWSNYFQRITNEVRTFENVPETLTASTLLGRGSADAGTAEFITLGTGLGMTGTVLSVTTTAASVTPFPNGGLTVLDPSAGFALAFVPGSTLTADRALTFTTGDAARTITLSGNPTLSDWFNQSVKTTASPAFAGLTVNGFAFTVNGAPTLNDWFNQSVKTSASPTFNVIDCTAYKVGGTSGVTDTNVILLDGGGTTTLSVVNGIVTAY